MKKMTTKLDAIAEAHPEVIAEAIFCLVPLRASTSSVLKMSLLPLPGKPRFFFANSDFWNHFKGSITTEARMCHYRLKDDKIKEYSVSVVEFERRLGYSLKLADIAREIWEGEAKVLLGGKYKIVYSEGDGRRLITSIAEDGGIPVVYLDADNIFFRELQSCQYYVSAMSEEEKDELQRQREGLWVQRINPEERSLIIAGAEHLRGGYGLDKRLLEKGMQLNIVGSFDRQKQIDAVFDGVEKE